MVLNLSEQKLSIPEGTEDVLGLDMRYREHIINIIKEVYENYGFNPHKTPILEYLETFNGHHGEGEKLFFHIKDKNDKDLIARYDLTVPLARVASMYPDLPRPYKRYQIGPSFRDDEPGKSHFREFTQCDADIIGADSLLAEIDITVMAHELLTILGIKNFVLKINHRLLIQALALKVGLQSKEEHLGLQRALDYADKVSKDGLQGVKNKLLENNIPLNIANQTLMEIESFANLLTQFDDLQNQINQIEKFFDNCPSAAKAAADLKFIMSYLPKNVQSNIKIDLTLARGADYYTGYILEGVAIDTEIGAILGGGRYNQLVSAVGNANEAGVGLAFGLERLLSVLKSLDYIDKNIELPSKILLANTNVEFHPKLFVIARELRKYYDVDIYYNQSPFGDIVHFAQQNKHQMIIELIGKQPLIHAVIENETMQSKVTDILNNLDCI
ncbi:hypothetical protein FCT18_06015 [Lysinibacillus sphaericus]|uniref:Histidyl-tRNA synthetase n=2 Tax=Lysinibacillus TaxID=400634 RepID=A0A2S0K179_LYSSH|nr:MULTISPECIES: ATP phosphoribosyltransferase regulatory subunit [Lysinibacillus]AHN24130.1 hypothetical protein T479_09915 [Lysinibacillus varians]AVK97145.1 hypothetical protein LS41612_13165 [Lysinibacillus sphaericus]MED4542429.1 ATP phosphoribosyltransferase regulatory subunit [Lysinibacillus sphaericus]TKI20417.1 hypothetical protein FCT18_06015 [Lysinibacillus sphaericus]TKI67574.1 hypothetical protein FC752_00890 [Lysinibacillus varians]